MGGQTLVLNLRRTSLAKIEHLNELAPTNTSHIYEGKTPIDWYALWDGEVLVGCFGLLHVAKEARLRGWFVIEEYRGRGIGEWLAEQAAVQAYSGGAEVIEAKTAQASIMARVGWTYTGKEYKSFNGRQYRKRL